jgi:hypothetical protein
MSVPHTDIPAETEALLKAISAQLGVTPQQALKDAVQAYATQMHVEEDDALPEAEWRAAVNAVAGMWKDRDDLPDFDELRKSWDRNVWGDRENE